MVSGDDGNRDLDLGVDAVIVVSSHPEVLHQHFRCDPDILLNFNDLILNDVGPALSDKDTVNSGNNDSADKKDD
jgi:hypothetical protein